MSTENVETKVAVDHVVSSAPEFTTDQSDSRSCPSGCFSGTEVSWQLAQILSAFPSQPYSTGIASGPPQRRTCCWLFWDWEQKWSDSADPSTLGWDAGTEVGKLWPRGHKWPAELLSPAQGRQLD